MRLRVYVNIFTFPSCFLEVGAQLFYGRFDHSATFLIDTRNRSCARSRIALEQRLFRR